MKTDSNYLLIISPSYCAVEAHCSKVTLWPFDCRGKSPISSFLWKGHKRIQKELMNLKLVEDRLDGLIKSCAQQLFEMTDDVENSAYPLTPG